METLKTIIAEITQVIDKLDEGQIVTFASELLAAPRVFVTGKGRSGLMAKAFAMRLMHLGLTVYVVGETTAPAIENYDTLVAVSGSGTTAETLHVVEQAKKGGCTIFVVTTNPESPLAKSTTLSLIIPAATRWRREGEVATQQPLGSLFDQCSHIALDAICLQIANSKHIDNEMARERHSNTE